MSNRSPRRIRLAVLTSILVVLGAAAACSSDSEGADPTTTITATSGTSSTSTDDDERPPGSSTTIDLEEPRTGTSLTNGTEAPPTGEETADDYADALIASFEEEPDDLFTMEDIECIAPKWVRAIGVDAFQAEGITPADLASGDAGIQDVVIDRTAAERIVEVMPECGVPLMDVFLDGLPSSAQEDPAVRACLEENVSDEQISEALIADIMGAEGDDPEDLAGDCLV